MKLRTAVTRLLGIDLPILQAGMSWASSCAALPAAVSSAGGLGVIAAGPMYRHDLERAISEVCKATDRPFAVNVPLYRKGVEEILDLIAAERVPILIASQGAPKRYIDRFKALGTTCIHVVASQAHALKAVEAGVDALVVVGGEAGGHPPPAMVSTLVMVRSVVKAVPETPVIASGGFADGAGLAAALSLGAGAAGFGTRFIATPEASVSDAYKRAVLQAGAADTRMVGCDLGVVRALANDFTAAMEALERAAAPLEERRARFAQGTLKMAAREGDTREGKVEAGQSAGLVFDLVPAGELVRRIAREYLHVVHKLPVPEAVPA